MKKKFILGLFFFGSIFTFAMAQAPAHTHISIDPRLYEAFDSQHLENLVTENPFLIQRWNYYLDNSWYLDDLPPEKESAEYPSVNIEDIENINILVLEREQQLRRDWDRRIIYRITGHQKVLVFYSGKEFTEKLNEHLNR